MSTFQFDPDFFEQRLLRCSALVKARRILVFMDAGQWFNLLRQEARARVLNRRYLVVPVWRRQGVFHPKLNLLIRRENGQIQCGSNNLTRSGCSSNLELVNSVLCGFEGESDETIRLGQEGYAFFRRACDDADQETGRIAREWLDECHKATPWLSVAVPSRDKRKVRLVHTYEGSLWERLSAMWDDSAPRKILIISPFYDADGEMVRRVHRRLPKCKIELVVQQQTTTLPVSALRALRGRVGLSEVRNSSRRLHAKLLAWESPDGTSCLVGSANCTSAALDAHNVEACLVVHDAEALVASLFDQQLGKRPITFEDFEPGNEQEPGIVDTESIGLRLICALLTEAGDLRVSYKHRLPMKPESLGVALRIPGEQRPRAFMGIPNKESGTVTVSVPVSVLKDGYTALLASLVAAVESRQEESPPMWVIQEACLTFEVSGQGGASDRAKVEETGDGLAELLEEVGRREGVSAVIEYLRHLSIRFYDGGGGERAGRKFRVRIRDPFHPDVAPEWLLHGGAEMDSLAEAIYDFADRHDKQRLRRHAKRGNINGMENFLDIFTALIRILYVYYVRGVVDRHQLISRVCNYLEVATTGIGSPEDFGEGYLHRLYENLGGQKYLQEVAEELNFVGHLRAALVVVQKVRASLGEPRHPRECLPGQAKSLRRTIRDVGLKEPAKADVMRVLEEYKMFAAPDLAAFEEEILGSLPAKGEEV